MANTIIVKHASNYNTDNRYARPQEDLFDDPRDVSHYAHTLTPHILHSTTNCHVLHGSTCRHMIRQQLSVCRSTYNSYTAVLTVDRIARTCVVHSSCSCEVGGDPISSMFVSSKPPWYLSIACFSVPGPNVNQVRRPAPMFASS